jgi:hypothetical protein
VSAAIWLWLHLEREPERGDPAPSNETHRSENQKVVIFFDPPGTKGSGQPSGGSEPAVGAVVLKNSAAAKITCILPRSRVQECETAIRAFIEVELSAQGVGNSNAKITTVVHGS